MQNKEENKSSEISPVTPGLNKNVSGDTDEKVDMSSFDPFANTIFDDICKL